MQPQPGASDPQTAKEPLVGPGFQYYKRPCRDVVWAVFFLLLVALTCGFAIYAAASMNDDASQLFHKDYHTDPKYCPLPEGTENTVANSVEASEATRTLQQAEEPTEEPAEGPTGEPTEETPVPSERIAANDSSFLEFLENAYVWLLASTFAAVVLGFIFVLLFSFFAAVMVYAVASLLVLGPLAAGIILVVAYEDLWGWAYIGAGVLIAIPLLCLHSQLSLTSKLLDLGADAIRDNLDLVFFSLCSNLVLLAALTGLLCFGILALTNGTIEVNDRVNLDLFPDLCVGTFGGPVDCCDWNMDNWVTGYWVLIIIMVIWTIFLVNQIRVYVVAGVVSQWYFADEENRGNMSIMKSLRFAMGPSFGSLVLSSLILTISNIIRRFSEWLAKKSQEENSNIKWLATCLACVIGVIAHIIEWVTDFAVVRMAITGESFFSAGKSVVDMMKHNLINAYAIWWFPPIVLFVCSFLMSLSVSVVLALAARNTWNDDEDLTDVRAWSWYLFLICFVLMMSVLYFFSELLIDAVNTIFVCFAIDRESKTEKNHKAHEVFNSLGMVGATTQGGTARPEERV